MKSGTKLLKSENYCQTSYVSSRRFVPFSVLVPVTGSNNGIKNTSYVNNRIGNLNKHVNDL
jgi:hypothetical protein